jgi:hypothetical protein
MASTENDQHAGMQVLGNGFDRGDHERHVGVLGLAQRRGDADVDRVEFRHGAVIGGGAQRAGADEGVDVGGQHVGDVRLAGGDRRNFSRVEVETRGGETRSCELHRERQADVTETDDSDTSRTRVDASAQFLGNR